MSAPAPSFTFARAPRVVFGAGRLRELPKLAGSFGRKALLVTGARSFARGERWDALTDALEDAGISVAHESVEGEPSPEFVDRAAAEHRDRGCAVVVGIGGGSAIDAAKAVSAMLGEPGSVVEYLEGVGTRTHSGGKLPVIAVPTTAGAGSEATKNAVLSQVGPKGFKKSLRHDRFIPDIALVDPELTLSCPPGVSAACGVDAFTQLLESFVSTQANPLTDALAWSGLEAVRDSLVPACTEGTDLAARTGMAYASLMSGMTLANAGLGVIHGLAGPIGGFFPAPHGALCGTLAAPAIEHTARALRAGQGPDCPGLRKYAAVGALLCGTDQRDTQACCQALVDRVRQWCAALNLPRLRDYGVSEGSLDRILDAAENKSNPVALDRETLRAILRDRL
ncbi:MAG: hypothetical protein A2X36_00475 [Elusimicrobia bacterium GWA2_69_24]|nr:MAG: hypothetical protein A2X36_00475 [Elusimicrobia bacterium GWA2_69_24]